MKKLSKTEVAYLAGLIDGEGTITMAKDRNNSGDRKLRFRVRLTITNTSVELVSWLVDRLEGFPQWSKVKAKNAKKHARSCRVSWSEKPASTIVQQILPFLIVKRQQAELFLRYRRLQEFCWDNRKASRKSIKSVRFLRDWYFEEFRRLNARGPKSVEANTPDRKAYKTAVLKIESELHGNMQSVLDASAGDSIPPTIQ